MINLRQRIEQDELLNTVNSYADHSAATMTWRIHTPHRITVVFLFSLASLIMLVTYLDGDLGNEPLYVLIVPMLFNFILIGYYVYKYFMSHGLVTMRAERRITPITGGAFGFAMLLIFSVMVFELLLCLRLRGIQIHLFWVFVPFWVFVIFGSIYLFTKMVDQHLKQS